MNWKITTEQLPEVGQKVWYHYAWIGTWEGIYIGEKQDGWGDNHYPTFEGKGGHWQADCPTYWMEWTEQKPEPPEESLELYKWAEKGNEKHNQTNNK